MYLRSTCSCLPAEYLDYLERFRFDPTTQVDMKHTDEDDLRLTISGLWPEVILYEITLLSLISEAYFKFVDTDWDYEGQEQKAKEKGEYLIRHGCLFAEFGTRRRRDFNTQYMVIKALVELDIKGPGKLIGTSNVYLARHFGIPPSGTVGHEWTMGIAALEGTYKNINSLALKKYQMSLGNLGIALTDTFGSKAFFSDFDYDLASKYNGVRHDSGDPFKFIHTVRNHYIGLGIDPTKFIIFSDGLDPEMAVKLQQACQAVGIKCSFGIGTNFTNDFMSKSQPQTKKSEAMNIVIKLFKCNDKFCVKLSDVKTKNTGNPFEIKRAQYELGI